MFADQSLESVILGSGRCFGFEMEQFLRNLQPRQDCPVVHGFPLVVQSFARDEWTAQIAPASTEKEAKVYYGAAAKFAQDGGSECWATGGSVLDETLRYCKALEQKFQVSGGAGDGVKPESGEVRGDIATVLRQLAKFLRLEGHVSSQPRDEL